MKLTGALTNGDYYTVYVAGEHYGFADFEYMVGPKVETQTYLTLGRNYYFEMPMRAAPCVAAVVSLMLLSFLLIVAAFLFTRRFSCRKASG